MGRKSLTIELSDGVRVGLRLTLAGQKEMAKLDPDGSVLQNILAAIDDPEAMSTLLTACLNWEGNNNRIKNGETLYDALVDDGYAGAADFGELVLDICKGSGLLKQEDCERVQRLISRTARAQSESLEEAAGDEEDTDDPLKLKTLDG